MRQKLLLAFLGILIVAGISFVLYNKSISDKTESRATSTYSGELAVSPQTSKDVVTIDGVSMSKNGWVVARAIEGNRLSQIIEISPYLEKGEHKNIQISLGEFYNGEELIAMIYADDGDGIFNDNDQPALDKDGKMMARYVTTGEVVPTAMMQPDPNAMAGHMMGGSMITVRYTNEGFVPTTLDVPVGTMIQFINESDKEMWVASNEHPGHEMLPTFDQFGIAKKGGNYMYTFDKVGKWPYHDHINPEVEGVIEVE